MSKKSLTMAAKLRKLKKGQSFIVPSESDRQHALRTAKTLRDAGMEIKITTYPQEGAFVVVAVL